VTHQVRWACLSRAKPYLTRQRKQQGEDQLGKSHWADSTITHIRAMALVGKLSASQAQPRCSACSGRRAVLASSGARVLGGPRRGAAAPPGHRPCRLRARSAHAAAVEQGGAVAAEPVERPPPAEDSVPEAREAGAVRIPLRACPCRGVPCAPLRALLAARRPVAAQLRVGAAVAQLVLLVLTSGAARRAGPQPGGAEQASTSEPAREEGMDADVAFGSGKRDDSKRLDYMRTRYKARKQDAKERLGAPTSEEGWKNDGRLRRTRPLGAKERCTDPFFQLGDTVTARIIWSNAKGARAELVQDKRLVGCGRAPGAKGSSRLLRAAGFCWIECSANKQRLVHRQTRAGAAALTGQPASGSLRAQAQLPQHRSDLGGPGAGTCRCARCRMWRGGAWTLQAAAATGTPGPACPSGSRGSTRRAPPAAPPRGTNL